MSNTDFNQNPARSPGNGASGQSFSRALYTVYNGTQDFNPNDYHIKGNTYQDTWDQLDEESLLLMTDKERGQLNAKLCRVNDPDCVACQ